MSSSHRLALDELEGAIAHHLAAWEPAAVALFVLCAQDMACTVLRLLYLYKYLEVEVEVAPVQAAEMTFSRSLADVASCSQLIGSPGNLCHTHLSHWIAASVVVVGIETRSAFVSLNKRMTSA